MPLLLQTPTNPGQAAFSAFAGTTLAMGLVAVTAQTQVIAVPGVLATDLVIANLAALDTGASLGPLRTSTGGVDTVTLLWSNAPVNNDGMVAYVVLRPDAP